MDKKEKNKHEILTHWWEYIIIIWWGFFPPSIEALLNGRRVETKKEINERLRKKIQELYQTSDKEKIDNFELYVNNRLIEEEERKKTIETKAQSLFGQTSISISILLAVLSLSIARYPNLPPFQFSIIWIFLCILLINFITVGLHARHALTLTLGYSYESIDLLIDKNSSSTDIYLERYWMSDRNSYLNDYKATFLKCSHWFFKCSLVITLIMALMLPLLNFFNSNASDQKKSSAPIIIKNNHSNVKQNSDSLLNNLKK